MSLSDKFKKLKEKEEQEPPKPKIQKAPKKILPIKKSVATLNTIKEILDDTTITQDDLWFFVRYLTREQISTFRISKKALEPIFKDFVDKKLKGAKQK